MENVEFKKIHHFQGRHPIAKTTFGILKEQGGVGVEVRLRFLDGMGVGSGPTSCNILYLCTVGARVGHPFFSKERSVLCILLHSL